MLRFVYWYVCTSEDHCVFVEFQKVFYSNRCFLVIDPDVLMYLFTLQLTETSALTVDSGTYKYVTGII